MKLDREDGTAVYLKFFDSVNPLRNRYQVTQQVAMEGRYESHSRRRAVGLRPAKDHHHLQPSPHEHAAAREKDTQFEIYHGDTLTKD